MSELNTEGGTVPMREGEFRLHREIQVSDLAHGDLSITLVYPHVGGEGHRCKRTPH